MTIDQYETRIEAEIGLTDVKMIYKLNQSKWLGIESKTEIEMHKSNSIRLSR